MLHRRIHVSPCHRKRFTALKPSAQMPERSIITKTQYTRDHGPKFQAEVEFASVRRRMCSPPARLRILATLLCVPISHTFALSLSHRCTTYPLLPTVLTLNSDRQRRIMAYQSQPALINKNELAGPTADVPSQIR